MPDQITIQWHAERLTGWEGFRLINAIDAASNAFAFSIPFEPTPENVERFRPFDDTSNVHIYLNEDLFLLGYIEQVTASTSAWGRTLSAEGRSASGGIVEWSAGSLWDRGAQKFDPEYTFQLDNVTGNQVARTLAAAHMVRYRPDTPQMSVVEASPGETIHAVLQRVATAHGYYGVPQSNGSLLYRKDVGTTEPVTRLEEGLSPVISVRSSHNAPSRAWKYVALGARPGVVGEQTDSEMAPAIRGVRIVKMEQESADIVAAAGTARSRGIIRAYSVSAVVSGFGYGEQARTFWRAGDVVTVKAPGAYILGDTKMVIKSATFASDEATGQTTTLELTLPEMYSGKYPEEKPWRK